MKSSVKSTESKPVSQPRQPLAGGGGLAPTSASPRDPYAVLDDLMVVVEALCPRWPARDMFKDGGDFRL